MPTDTKGAEWSALPGNTDIDTVSASVGVSSGRWRSSRNHSTE